MEIRLKFIRKRRVKRGNAVAMREIDSGKGTERFRADYKNTSRREIPPEEDQAGDGGYNCDKPRT